MSNIEDTVANKMTFAEMKEQKEALEHAIEQERANAQREAIAQIVEVAKSHDLTAKDIAKAMNGTKVAKTSKPKTSGSKVAPKYKDPNSEGTWTGRGRKPKWFVEAEEAGANMDDYLITPVETTPEPVAQEQAAPQADYVEEVPTPSNEVNTD